MVLWYGNVVAAIVTILSAQILQTIHSLCVYYNPLRSFEVLMVIYFDT